jgi:hypothetical protein
MRASGAVAPGVAMDVDIDPAFQEDLHWADAGHGGPSKVH